MAYQAYPISLTYTIITNNCLTFSQYHFFYKNSRLPILKHIFVYRLAFDVVKWRSRMVLNCYYKACDTSMSKSHRSIVCVLISISEFSSMNQSMFARNGKQQIFLHFGGKTNQLTLSYQHIKACRAFKCPTYERHPLCLAEETIIIFASVHTLSKHHYERTHT